MKKQLIALAVIISGITASAVDFSTSLKKLPPVNDSRFTAVEAPANVAPFKAPAKAEAAGEEDIFYTLAGSPYSAFSLNGQAPGVQLAMAFQIDPSFLSGLTDGEITGISYYTGCESNNQNINKITKAHVFITDDLTAKEFLYTQDVDAPATGFTQVNVTLDEPFKIPADKKIYCGVYFNFNSENNAALVVDGAAHLNDLGGWYAFRQSSTQSWSWMNATNDVGFMTLGATLRAAAFPENSVSLVAIDGQPVAYEGEAFTFQFLLQNTGVNPVKNVTVNMGVDSEELLTQTFGFNQPLELNQLLIGTINQYGAKNAAKSANMKFDVVAVNGETNTSVNGEGSYPMVIVPQGKGLDRNVVIEEFTSTSCTGCPVGYTSMEMIHEKYTDGTVIPVCIHVNVPGRDPMTVGSYNSVFTYYGGGSVPSATVNRTFTQYPIYEDLVEIVEEMRELPGIAAVSADASIEDGTRNITVNTKTTFSFDYTDGDQNFILAYGITEDNVGPYTQQNGYSGENMQVPGGWQNQPATVQLIYNDVARQLDRFSGVPGSIPAEIANGEEYDFSHTFAVVNAVNDLSKISVVVYLINRKTGAIENACVVKDIKMNDSGIDSVIADDNEAPVEYFNLQGIRVSDPAAGLYIRRQGNNVTKVLVR
ncbi:MAG: hypothetical protein K2K68_09455 [Duncaniella sp.]|nr:hypothetical protein [Duncaniella sp.]